jgi:type II secretory pathway pseudopilin PulG
MEVMIGFAVLTMVAGGILSGLVQGRRLANQNLLAETAFTVAQSYLEELKAIAYKDLVDGDLTKVRDPLTNKATLIRLIDVRATPTITSDDLRIELTPEITVSQDVSTPLRPVGARDIKLTYGWRKEGEPVSTLKKRTLCVIRADCTSF